MGAQNSIKVTFAILVLAFSIGAHAAQPALDAQEDTSTTTTAGDASLEFVNYKLIAQGYAPTRPTTLWHFEGTANSSGDVSLTSEKMQGNLTGLILKVNSSNPPADGWDFRIEMLDVPIFQLDDLTSVTTHVKWSFPDSDDIPGLPQLVGPITIIGEDMGNANQIDAYPFTAE